MTDICSIKDVIKRWIDQACKLKLKPSLCCSRIKSHSSSNQEDSHKLWSELPSDILDEVIRNLDSSKDYLHLIAVCRSWRLIGRESRDLKSNPRDNIQFFHPLQRKHSFPMLLQPCKKNGDLQYFYSVTKRKVKTLNVPEMRNKWIAGSCKGWLVTLDMRDVNVMHLLNPITRVKILLPPLLSTNPGEIYPKFNTRINKSEDVEKVLIISSKENFKQSSCTIFALERSRMSLHICKIGDDKWKKILVPKVNKICDVINFKGITYFVANFGSLFAIELDPIIEVTPIITDPNMVITAQRYYLVESSGDLLLIARFTSSIVWNRFAKDVLFKIYKLEEEHECKIWKEIESLHDQVLFVGRSESICLDSKLYHNCEGNCIYFSDDSYYDNMRAIGEWALTHENGVFHINDGKKEYFIEPLNNKLPLPAMWFSPNPS